MFGLSGAGKTTVAVTVARANVTSACFPDGVYWLTDSQVRTVLYVILRGCMFIFLCCTAKWQLAESALGAVVAAVSVGA